MTDIMISHYTRGKYSGEMSAQYKSQEEKPRCENDITEPWDTTGEFAQVCNAPATLRGDVYLCEQCANSAKEK